MPRLVVLALAALVTLGGCRKAPPEVPAPGTAPLLPGTPGGPGGPPLPPGMRPPARAAEPDTALVAVLGELHLLEARQARAGDVPPGLRAEVLAAHGYSEVSLRRAVVAAQQDAQAWEQLFVRLDQWLLDPARGGGSYARPDGVEGNLGSPSLPPELKRAPSPR